jgi:hypothetical protein
MSSIDIGDLRDTISPWTVCDRGGRYDLDIKRESFLRVECRGSRKLIVQSVHSNGRITRQSAETKRRIPLR